MRNDWFPAKVQSSQRKIEKIEQKYIFNNFNLKIKIFFLGVLCVFAKNFYISSIFLAKSKSLFVKPPVSCVVIENSA